MAVEHHRKPFPVRRDLCAFVRRSPETGKSMQNTCLRSGLAVAHELDTFSAQSDRAKNQMSDRFRSSSSSAASPASCRHAQPTHTHTRAGRNRKIQFNVRQSCPVRWKTTRERCSARRQCRISFVHARWMSAPSATTSGTVDVADLISVGTTLAYARTHAIISIDAAGRIRLAVIHASKLNA